MNLRLFVCYQPIPTEIDLLANHALESARQHVALLDHVMATIPSAGSAIKDPDRLRRLLSRPALPVEWNLSVGPGPPPLAPYDESLVE